MVPLIVAAAAVAHIPFFADVDVAIGIQRPVATSQVYYFKGDGMLVATAATLPSATAVELLVPESYALCEATVTCDGNVTSVPLQSKRGRRGEPWTQSSYRLVREWGAMTCNASFSVAATCADPWAVVVGTDETFEMGTWTSMPATVAKIHGSYWSKRYLAGYNVAVFAAAAIIAAAASKRKLSYEQLALVVAAVFVAAIWVAKLYHAAANAGPKGGAAFGVSLMEGIGAAAIAWLWIDDRRAVGAAGIAAGGIMLALGLGFAWGGIAIIVAGIIHAAPQSAQYTFVKLGAAMNDSEL